MRIGQLENEGREASQRTADAEAGRVLSRSFLTAQCITRVARVAYQRAVLRVAYHVFLDLRPCCLSPCSGSCLCPFVFLCSFKARAAEAEETSTRDASRALIAEAPAALLGF